MSKFLCDIVTPEKELFSEEINFVVVPGSEGEIGLLAQHAPTVSTLKMGEIRLKMEADSETESYLVNGGYVEAIGTKVVVLASRAEKVGNTDIAEVKAKKAEAEAKLSKVEEEDSRAAFYREEVAWYTFMETLLQRKQ
ncbi:MAG TPA: ATP synthase F1 subunit epsilon [Coriobacteriia bacterium]|nr:ATP synthase F1 subunit epsilon [Coriobacteriia bacterium]